MDNLKNILRQRDNKTWAIALTIVLITIGIVIWLNSSHNKITNDSSLPVVDIASGTKHSDLKDYFTKQINKKIVEQNDKVKLVEDKVKSNQDRIDEIANLKKQNEDMAEQLKLLNERMDNAKSFETQVELPPNNPNRRRVEYDPNILPAASNIGKSINNDNYNQELMQPQLINSTDEIEIVSVELAGVSKDITFKEVATYLPAGTHIRGIILGGVDAHTEVYGNNQTRVVTIKLRDDGDIPNGYKGKLKNCILLASAWGNASSERVAMRGERLSCVGNTGKVLETDITATIYGPDGKQDVRGRVVYPEGKLLERAFLAGSLSGLGSGVAQSFTTQSISPLGATSVIQGADVLKQGAAAGVGKGLDKLSDYYIKRAEQLQPIIQVGSGTEVDVVIQKGFYLDGKAHTEAISNIAQTPFENTNPKYDAKVAANGALANLKETMQ